MYAGVRALLKFEVKAKSSQTEGASHYRIEYISSPGRYLVLVSFYTKTPLQNGS